MIRSSLCMQLSLPIWTNGQPDRQSMCWPRGNPALDLQFEIAVREFHLEPPYQSRQQTSKFGFCKPLANATPWTVQEGQESVVAGSTTRVRPTGPHPSIGLELTCILAPELRRLIDRPWSDEDEHPLRNALAQDRRTVGTRFANGKRYRRKEAKGFLADCMEQGKLVDRSWSYGRVGVDGLKVVVNLLS